MADLQQTQTRPPSMDDRVIVVMGPTGSGKTTFINCVAERNIDKDVGHDIDSCTKDVQTITVPRPIHGRNIIFIDTPGFEDPEKSDMEVLAMIAAYLVGTYKTRLQVDTILYLHRISHNKMTGPLLKNLRVFVSLCGIQSMPSVIIVTTMWERSDLDKMEAEEKREKQLIERTWYDMIQSGCGVKRFHLNRRSPEESYNSALEILTHRSQMTEAPLVSSEMVDRKKKLKETAAGNALRKEMKDLVKQHKAARRRLEELSNKATNDNVQQTLQEEIEKLNEKMKGVGEQLSQLKRGLFSRLFGSKPETGLVPKVGSPSVDPREPTQT